MRIYTKVGDGGNTSLYDGTKVSKDNIIIDCVGDLDELNSELGCIIAGVNDNIDVFNENMEFVDIIKQAQVNLFDMGSLLAHPTNPESKNLYFDKDNVLVKELETNIDKMTAVLPKLTNFILPGGNLLMAFTHKTRTVCRRFERKLINLRNSKQTQEGEYVVENSCIAYINRLSDYLFTFARFVGFLCKTEEIIYKRRA
jgi:cob(I)alamin adenosyltransferase